MQSEWKTRSSLVPSTVSELVSELERLRGIESSDSRNEFYNPKDPFQIEMKDVGLDGGKLNRFQELIKKVVEKEGEIVIFGDYDVDGVTSTAIAWESLDSLNISAKPYLPDRFSEGYGLTKDAVEKLNKLYPNLKLIICVDNGIVAHDAIVWAKKKFKNHVVVIDHHEKDGNKLEADIVFHNTTLCAGSLTWFVFRDILVNAQKKDVSKGQLTLAALATVCDQVKLNPINRALLKEGLSLFPKTNRPGFACFLESLGMQSIKVTPFHLGFVIGPKINAAGRMGHAIDALRLLCTRNKQRARELCDKLTELNTQRQLALDSGVELAMQSISHDRKILVIVGQFHEGVVGLIASKLSYRFSKPAIIISSSNVGKGSARSVEGFHITNFIRGFDSLLSVGGHEMASGFSVSEDKIDLFLEYVKKNEEGVAALSSPVGHIADVQLPGKLIDEIVAEKIATMAPFGTGNPEPLFLIRQSKIVDKKWLGSEKKHLKFKLENQGRQFDGISFGHKGEDYPLGALVDVLGSLEINVWGTKKTLQCIIKDVKNSSPS